MTTTTDARASSGSEMPYVTLLGVRFAAVTELRCIEAIMDALDAGHGGWVVTANLDHLRRLVDDSAYAQLCRDASILVADGMPLVWASRLQGTPLPQRVAGSNLISSLSASAARHGRSVYLLGGEPGTAEQAAAVLSDRHPNLRIAGTSCPTIEAEAGVRQIRSIAETLRAAEPDVVFVALGSPKQERVIEALRAELPGVWWLGVGISFSFLCGQVKRAPGWVQRIGFEWMHRMLQEPRRLARRYLAQGLPFALRLMGGAVHRRISAGGRAARPDNRPGKRGKV